MYLLLFYNIKNRLHFSSQCIEFNAECAGSFSEIPAYTRDTLVLFRFLAVRSPHSENNRST